MPHDRVVVKNGVSWSLTSSKDYQSFAFKKNVCEHATGGFKIVAECKEDMFLEGFAVQHA